MKNLKKIIFSKYEEKFIKNNNKDIFYAGYWASNLIDLKNINYLNCIWSSDKEKDQSYKFLNKKYDKYIRILTNYFNNYHNVKYNKRYWETICGMWLNTYLSTVYYRWRVIEKISSKNKIKINNYNFKNFFLTTNNSIDYYSNITRSDTFNNLVFFKIIDYFIKYKKFKPILEKKKINFKNNNYKKINLSRNYSLKTKFLEKVFEILDLISTRKKNFIIVDGFNNRANLKINLRAFQLPFATSKYFNNELSINTNLFNIKKREKNIAENKTIDDFEKFLERNIYYDIPKIFLENFLLNLNLVKSYKIRTKKVISGTFHFFNELFKIWLAQQSLKNDTSFIITCHGGNHSKFNGIFNYENNISDQHITWVKSEKHNLPASKYIDLKKKRDKLDNLILVVNETNPYPAKWEDFPVSLDNLRLDFFLKKFQFLLNKKIKKNFFVCPKYLHCSKFQKIIKRNLDKTQIKKSFSFPKELDNARLVICDNPQTAFIDALRTGPTILIVKKNQWRPKDVLKKNYQELEKNNIVFYSIDRAIKHINENWDNIDKWWFNKNTIKAVSNFLSMMNCVENISDNWLSFLKK